LHFCQAAQTAPGDDDPGFRLRYIRAAALSTRAIVSISAKDPLPPVTTGSLRVAQFIAHQKFFVADFNVTLCRPAIKGRH